MKYLKLLPLIFVLAITSLSCRKANDNPATTDYSKLIIGKWFWYKTLIKDTSSGQTGVDTFYNSKSFYTFTSDGKVYRESYYPNTGQTERDTMKYWLINNQLGLQTSWNKDTIWTTILGMDNNTFSYYSKDVYTTTSPPTAVEYWQYFIR